MKSSLRWAFGLCIAGRLIMVAVALHLWGAAENRCELYNVRNGRIGPSAQFKGHAHWFQNPSG